MVHRNANPINSDINENNMHIPIQKHGKSANIKKECCKEAHHRTITRYGHELLDEVEKVIEIKENLEEYKKRSSTLDL